MTTPRDFTALDQATILDRLLRLHQSNFPQFDPETASIDRATFEEHSTVAEMLSFYIEKWGGEHFLQRATDRQSHLDLGGVFGFVPTTRVAARADLQVTITRSVVPGATFVFSAGTEVRTRSTGDPIVYQTLDDLEFVPDGNPEQILSVNAENSTSVEDVRLSEDTEYQRWRLSTVPFIDDTLVLTDDLGSASVVRTFAETGPDDFHVKLSIDTRERVTVLFGGGDVGRVPVGQIRARYRVGGGVIGDVEENALTVLGSAQFTDEDGNAVLVSVTNPDASSKGADRQTIAELKREIPRAAQTRRRTVSRSDYENGAITLVGTVARTIALTLNETPSIVPLNETWVYLVPKGGGPTSQETIDQVEEIYEDDGTLPSPNTSVTRVFDAPRVAVDVVVRAFRNTSVTRETMRDTIVELLQQFFDPENFVTDPFTDEQQPTVSFGYGFAEATGQPDGQLSWSSIFAAIEESPAVAKIEDSPDRLLLNGTDSDVDLAGPEFPELGDVTVIDAATGTVVV